VQITQQGRNGFQKIDPALYFGENPLLLAGQQSKKALRTRRFRDQRASSGAAARHNAATIYSGATVAGAE
jgi:hypothetical protein